MSRRRRRWVVGLLAVLIALIGGLWISYRLVLPALVRREVVSALVRLGIADVSFDLRSATLWGSDLAEVRGGRGEITASGVEVRYSPVDALGGRLDSILLEGARLLVDLNRPRALKSAGTVSSAPFDLPFERLELKSCVLALKHGNHTLEIPIGGTLVNNKSGTADLQLKSSIGSAPLSVSGTINSAAGSIDISADAANVDVSVLRDLFSLKGAGGMLTASARYTRTDGKDITTAKGELNDGWFESDKVSAYQINGMISFDDLLKLTTPAAQRINIGRIMVGQQQLTDAVVSLQVAGAHAIRVAHLNFTWADGEVRADPFTIDPTNPVIDTTVLVNKVQLKDAMALLTGGRATGDGTVSGSVPIRADWPNSLTFGEGSLRADGPGNLRMGDANDKFGKLLEKSNPGFASDPALGELKTDVLDAVQNFDFHLLEVRFHKTGEWENALIRLHGRGKTARRLPINLDFNVSWRDEDLADYLKAQSRVLSSVSGKAANP